MDILNLVPIEFRGMSILTVIILAFMIVGFKEYDKMVKKTFEKMEERCKTNESKIEAGHQFMNSLKTDVALLLQSVTRIEKLLERGQK